MLLAVIVAFAVLLPRLGEGSHAAAELPDTLPGGWTSLEDLDVPEGAPDDFLEQQAAAVDYVRDTLAEVYDDGTAFRAYATEDRASFATLTVFESTGGAFTAPDGILSDPEALGLDKAPVELVREGDALCVVNNQTGQSGQPSDPEAPPLSVNCQLTAGGQTYQIGTQQLSVAEAVELLEAAAG